MYRRKLEALEYHNYANFDGNNEEQFRALVLWLEDQKIRHYKIEDRDALRDVTSPNWPNAFKKYCTDIESPINSADKHEHLEWLLGFAVRLIYEDNCQTWCSVLLRELKLRNLVTD